MLQKAQEQTSDHKSRLFWADSFNKKGSIPSSSSSSPSTNQNIKPGKMTFDITPHFSLPPKKVIDKMLFNYRNIGLIHLLYPNAVILHTVRDPLDNLLSCFRNKFDDFGLEWSLDESHLVIQYTNNKDDTKTY